MISATMTGWLGWLMPPLGGCARGGRGLWGAEGAAAAGEWNQLSQLPAGFPSGWGGVAPVPGWRMQGGWPEGGGEGGGAPASGGRAGRSWHEPVMLEEVVEALRPASGRLILDGTLGGGGHTRALLERGASVVGIDQDPEAIAEALRRVPEDQADRFVAIRANFADFPSVLEEAGLTAGLDGILLDIGTSSHQLDTAERGFSFQREGPLDMRMNPDGPVTAADLVNHAEPEELERILFAFGEERQARRIVREIVRRRGVRPLATTLELAAAVEAVVPRRGGVHPATRTFQALRIAVNDELGALERALGTAHLWLKPGGRLAVITFHSLEDRIVKHWLRSRSEPEIDRPEWPAPRPNPECYYRLVTRKPLEPGPDEIARNPRARSARLRVAERLPHKSPARTDS